MKLVVVSHKLCSRAEASPTGYVTDGGFPLQMQAISALFSQTSIIVPCRGDGDATGLSPLVGNNLNIVPLSVPRGHGLRRKLALPAWLARNFSTIFREVRRADAVHTPIPGDIGTIGMVVALLLRKPLFVRHCGNWMVQRTVAERFWKWMMERYAGGRNVMLATGGGTVSPSETNSNIKWIFSTSMSSEQMKERHRKNPPIRRLRLIIVCRQEEGKGTDVVIDSLPLIAARFPDVTLDVVGSGAMLPTFKRRAELRGLSDRVTFHGNVPQSEVPELMTHADIFCYPTASEGFPKVVVEALACGLPVVTTAVSVLPYLISSGGGIILDRVTPESLAEAVEKIGSNQELYSKLSSDAIKTAAQYTLENWAAYIAGELRQSWSFDVREGSIPGSTTV